MLIQIVLSFFACLAFAIIFNASKSELPYCGLTGVFGWIFFVPVNEKFHNIILATFAASIAITVASRFLSHVRRAPSTMFLLPGILPLVPGANLYNTMYGILNGDMAYSYTEGAKTLKLAGVIAIGIILVLSLPYSVFNFIKLKD